MAGWLAGIVNVRRITTARIACAVCIILSTGPSQNATAAPGDVNFCFNDWQPYATVRDGEPTGISIEILREAARRAGVVAAFTELPWNRCLKMVADGQLDAVIDAAARDNFLQGPTSVARYTNTFWVRDEDTATAYTPETLAKRRIGLVDGYSYPASLQALIEESGAQVEYSVDDATSIRKLSFNRVDIIVGDMVSTSAFAREFRLRLRPLTPSHSVDRLYPSFNRDRAEQQRAFDRALAELLENGEVDRIYRKYTGMSFDEIAVTTAAGKP